MDTFNADGAIALPADGDFLRADFDRAGPDLLIETPSGGQFIVPDYFMAETPPALALVDGAVLKGKVVTALAGPQNPAMLAQDAPIMHPDLGEPIGQVNESEGVVTVTHPDGRQESLTTGGQVFQGDVLETASGSNVSIIFVDDTVFSLDEDGRMILDEMVYDPDTQTGVFNAEVVQGVFSFVSGQVAKTSPDGMVVSTPSATIGIRGSTGLVDLKNGKYALVNDVGGTVGELTITNGVGVVTLNQVGASTTVLGPNSPPTPFVILSPAEIQQSFGGSLTKLVKVVAQKAEQDAQQAEAKAQKSEQDAQQADEEAAKADAEAAQAQADADQAQAEADQAQADLDAAAAEVADAKAAAEAAGDEEALAKAKAAEAELAKAEEKVAAMEAQAKTEAQAAAQAKADAQVKAAEAATKAAEAEVAQAQAAEAQQFSSMADTAFTSQTLAFEQVQQNPPDTQPQDTPQDGPQDGPAQTANTADTADTVDGPPPDDTLLGDPLLGDPLLGDPLLGDPLLGDPLLDDPLLGDPLLSEPLPDTGFILDPTLPPPPDTTTTTQTNLAPVFANTQSGATQTVPGVFDVIEDNTISGTVIATDPDGDPVSYSVDTTAAGGTVTVDAVTGDWAYTPNANFNGFDTFIVAADDGLGGVTTHFVDVDVQPVNDAPVAGGTLSDTMLLGGTVIFQTSHLNATDVDNASFDLIYTVGTVPTTGAVQLSNVALATGETFTQADVDAGLVKYVQNGTAATSDTFTYTVSDGAITTAAQTFTMSISDTLTNPAGTTLSIAADLTVPNVVNDGILDVTAGTISTPTSVVNNGTLNMTGGTFSAATVTNAAGGVINHSSPSHLANYMVNNGTLNVTGTAGQLGTLGFTNNGVLDIASGVTVTGAYNYMPVFSDTSSIQGNGTFKTAVQSAYTYNGIWNPGTDGTVGSLTMDTWDASFSRTVHMSATTVYNVDVASNASFDTLTLTTAFASTLDGTLNLKSVSGYTATAGDSFQVLNYTTGSSGDFTYTHDFGASWYVFATYGTTALTMNVQSAAGTVTGTAGTDVFKSTTANNTVDGGAGTDTFDLNGAQANYTMSFAANGALTLTDTVGTDGTDTLSNIETLGFTDGNITVATGAVEHQANTTTSASTPTPGTNGSTDVMMLENGNSLVYWTFKDSGTAFTDMRAQLYDPAGQAIGVEFQLNDSAAANAGSWQETYAPKFAALANGGFVATWQSFDQPGDLSTWAVVARYFNADGTPATGEILVNTSTFSEQSDPVVVQVGNDEYMFVWKHIEPTTQTKYDIHAQRMDASGNKIGAEFTVNTTDVNNDISTQRLPDVTALSNGGYAIVWDSDNNDGSGNATMMRIYNADNTALTGEIQVNQATTGWQEYPHVTTLNNGNIAVVWQGTVTAGGSGYDVGLRLFDSAGTALGNEVIVNTTTSLDQAAPQIAALDGGGFVVTWHTTQNAADNDIYAQVFDASGAKVGTEFMVNDASALYNLNPSITGTFDGGFIISWAATPTATANNGNILFKRFDANGNELGLVTLTGDANNNTFNIEPSKSLISIDGGAGTDSVVLGGTAADTNLVKLTGVETVTGGAGKDFVMLTDAVNNNVTVNLSTGHDAVKLSDLGNTIALIGVEDVIGGTGADNVTMSLALAAANDAFLDGAAGVDTLNLSSAGNNTFNVQNFEIINGGSATDTISSKWGLNLDGVTLSGIENIAIDSDNNDSAGLTLTGTTINSALTITGTGNNDGISSTGNLDLTNVTLSGIKALQVDSDSATANTVGAVLTLGAQALPAGLAISGSGDDIIQMAGTSLDLSGATTTGISQINGTAGNDTIVGTAGTDVISGGGGGDVLLGGAGSDIFKYTATSDGGVAGDTISDFTQGIDLLHFDSAIFNSTTTAGNPLNVGDFSTSVTATEGSYFIYNTTNSTLYYDTDGAVGGSMGMAIAVLDDDANPATAFTLTAADIVMA